ncbi:MAG TPA: hypothetical protein VK203_11595 [Nostocaceae cyanobacterium]|nr:hypothetical protein [Nostocaceae cyanobacterium]
MPLFFLITLVTGLATTYLFKKKSDEVNYIAGVLMAICFILSLILAPWQMQLGILIFIVFGTNKFLQN